MQECRETTDAIIEADNEQLQKILNANKHKDKYWIVLFAKPSKRFVEGKPTLIKVLKAYSKKPTDMVGMIVGEVDNTKGTIDWTVNMPDVPFDYNSLPGEKQEQVIVDQTTIPDAYVSAAG